MTVRSTGASRSRRAVSSAEMVGGMLMDLPGRRRASSRRPRRGAGCRRRSASRASARRTAGCPRPPRRSGPRTVSSRRRSEQVLERPVRSPSPRAAASDDRDAFGRLLGPLGVLLQELAGATSTRGSSGASDSVDDVARAGRGTSAPPSGCRRSRRRAAAPGPVSSSNRRAAQNVSSTGNAASDRPIAAATRSAASPSSLAERRRAASTRAVSSGVVVADPGRLAHDLGQRPERDALAVGKAAPAQRRCAVAARSAGTPAAAGTSRRPPAPNTVTSWQARSRSAALESARRGPPALGSADDRRVEPSRHAVVAARRRIQSGRPEPRSALPLSSSGSTGSTSTASRTRRYVGSPIRISHGRRALLEPRGDVHRVAGDEPLTRRRRRRPRPRRC